ncbi:MAG: hypothetical protein AAF567_06965 [Actinomycetota bacterium]
MPQGVTAVVLTALAEEAAAFEGLVDDWEAVRSDHRHYFEGKVGRHSVVVWPINSMGNVRSAVAAQQAVAIWNPRSIFLSGIAGGFGDEVALGDVLVADQMVAYELGKIRESSTSQRFEVFRPSRELLDIARGVAHDSVWRAKSEQPSAEVRFGPIASGEKVVANEAWTESFGTNWEKAVGVEMESMGIAASIYYAGGPDFLMVKGVSDHADHAKSDDSRQVAARNAAAFTCEAIRALPVDLDSRRFPHRRDIPRPRSGPNGWGRARVLLCRQLSDLEVRELAACFEVPTHERQSMRGQEGCHDLWDWLDRSRGRLEHLPFMLNSCLERDDLATLVTQAIGPHGGTDA